MKKIFDIKYLDCANCAQKIEAEYSKLKGVTKVSVNYAREKVYLEGEVEQYTAKKLEVIAKKVEKAVTVSDENSQIEYVDKHLTKVQWITYAMGMFFLITGFLLNQFIRSSAREIVPVPFYTAAYLIFGWDVLSKAFKNILKGKFFDENFLMTLATIGAFATTDYIEAIAVMLFYRVGEYLQDISISRSRKNIKELVDIRPSIAHLLTNDGIFDILPERLKVGQLIVVRPGEKVPVDGIITEGSSWLDTASITGESIPRDAYEGTEVISGSINISGLITVQVMKSFEDSTVSKIIDFVENNQANKAEAEKFITKFAKYYTPFVVGMALILAFIVPWGLSIFTTTTFAEAFSIYFRRALIFLVISCPCALVLSIPLSFFAGIGAASRKGILFKSGSDLEMMSRIDHFVFDKTGTLTQGKFKLFSIVSGEPELILEYAAHAEYHSNHPIAKSILKAYGKDPDPNLVLSIAEIAGKGMKANYKGINLLVGNHKLLDDNKIKYMKTHEIGTIVYVVANKEYMGYLVIKDVLKKRSKRLIQELKKQNKEITMLTGDFETAAMDVGFHLDIENYYANCLPEDKIRIVEELSKKSKVAFIGDGINDAPVLAISHLGIAMGGIGSDAAIEAADAVIMNDDPYQVIIAQRIAKKTMRIVLQNIVMALGIKGIVLILGALGFANLWLAIFADVGVSILAVANAMRIFRTKA
ncbi:MAG: cadmium-translocating P-type ATPase [Tenericutes bacterium HGW-Tenericutes-2]|jgi:Cd2+/Zn2+-exporting ATPase|nr:MAG: cadmium-translocating P-type ATPase [Tenericutes bacterium HGW-Tenericutes-2]